MEETWEASRADQGTPGAMAGLEAREAMADPGTQEAMAGLEVREAMAYSFRVARAGQGAQWPWS